MGAAAFACGLNNIGFSFAAASMSDAILMGGIEGILTGMTVITAMGTINDCRRWVGGHHHDVAPPLALAQAI